MWSISLGTACLAMVFLSASVSDVRSREVPDIHWWIGGAAASAVAGSSFLASGTVPALAAAVGGISVTAALLSERVPSAAASVSALLSYAVCFACVGPAAAVTPATVAVLVLMYRLGLIRGGADAKALAVVAVAYPVYPDLGPFPLLWEMPGTVSLVMNPCFSVLSVALAMTLLAVPAVLAANMADGYAGKGMLSTYRMNLDDAEGSYVWPAEDVSDGRNVPIPPGSGDGGEYARLREAGYDDVRVSPMLPFLVPVTASLFLVLVLGSPLAVLTARC